MNEYRNMAGHPEDLASGRVVGTGEFFTLSDEDLKSEFNKRKIESGKFVQVSAVKEPAKLPKKEREALVKKAQELNVENAEELEDNDLASAVAEAEKQKEA